jgi:pyruvyl transferase EpsO
MSLHPEVIVLQKKLYEVLENLGEVKDYILLDYPNNGNAGDHFIALGEMQYLKKVKHAEPLYIATHKDISYKKIDSFPKDTPIFITGGGNLGDLWLHHQIGKEEIVTRYPDRKIVIFPQSIYFKEEANLKRAQTIFNSHPDLTIFVRDESSFEIAQKNFTSNKVILCPDMAFALDLSSFNYSPQKTVTKTLLLCRHDKEKGNKNLYWSFIKLVDEFEDWVTFSNKTAVYIRIALLFGKYKKISEYILAQSIKQLSQYKLVGSERLHGHVLATLMGIPNILVANSYFKNEALFTSWTHSISYTRFVKTEEELNKAFKELTT